MSTPATTIDENYRNDDIGVTSLGMTNDKDAAATLEASSLQEPLLPRTTVTPVSVVSVDEESSPPPDEGAVSSQELQSWEPYGQTQPTACRDVVWGVLFVLQLTVVFVLAVMGMINLVKEGSEWMPYNDYDDDDTTNNNDDKNGGGGGAANMINGAGIGFFVTIAIAVAAVSFLILKLLLGVLAQMMIQISLVLSPVCFGITFVLAMITFNIPLAFFALFMSALGVFYAWGVWHRIPFATANIEIAMKALQDNRGLWIVAYLVTMKAYLWTLIWVCTFLQVFVFSPSWVYDCQHYDDDDDDDQHASSSSFAYDTCQWSTRGRWIVVALLLSLFWTAQVLKNIFHTTIAGVVGTWWFDPADAQQQQQQPSSTTATTIETNDNDNNNIARPNQRTCFACCGFTPAIYDSCWRSCTYSFGSICFGSLLVGIVQVIQLLVRCGRQQQHDRRHQQDGLRGPRGGDLFCCLLQCIVDNLEYLLRYFNRWAFVYVGLYGYDYWTAGKRVTALFQARGWSNIINDQLVGRALAMMSILIGLITGIMGTLIGFFFLGPLGAMPTFFVGMVLGGMSCDILFGVVTSAVNTIVVCFAESPEQLRTNHPPELFQQLVQSWRIAYPQECGF